MPKKPTEEYCPAGLADWYEWLEKNHRSEQSVWLVLYNKKSEKESIQWSDAVDAALCFGWIDSKRQTMDDYRYRQFYSKRKANSIWSKINKQKVERLIARGQMKPAGYEVIERAKQDGSWTILDEVEELIIPEDLQAAFAKHKGAEDYFLSLSKSIRKAMLAWVLLAKRPETRQKRIDEIAKLAGKGQKPKQFR